MKATYVKARDKGRLNNDRASDQVYQTSSSVVASTFPFILNRMPRLDLEQYSLHAVSPCTLRAEPSGAEWFSNGDNLTG